MKKSETKEFEKNICLNGEQILRRVEIGLEVIPFK